MLSESCVDVWDGGKGESPLFLDIWGAPHCSGEGIERKILESK